MRAILLGPLKGSEYQEKLLWRCIDLRTEDLRVGVDGGLQNWYHRGIKPHFAVGDWDSLKDQSLLKKVPCITLPRSKDRSDLFFAGIAALEAGAQELCCLGMTGGQWDHHLAALYELSWFSAGKWGPLKRVIAYGWDGVYHFLSEKIPQWSQSLALKTKVSIFSLSEMSTGVLLQGFRYPMKQSSLISGSQGLSNYSIRKHCHVSLKKGRMLLVLPNREVA